MKILILSMQRNMSKHVLYNMHLYLTARFGNALRLDEFFNHHCTNTFTNTIDLVDDKLIRTDIPIESKEAELEKRIAIFRQINQPCVVKHFPAPLDDTITPILLSIADKVFYLRRDDVFANALSICIGELTQAWLPGKRQKAIIEELIETPAVVSENRFIGAVSVLMWYNNQKQVIENSISMEDIAEINSSGMFCKLFRLEHADFIYAPLGLEYGEHKYDMVANLPRLREIFYSLTKKYDTE